jgi:cell division protein FtsZ
MRLHEVNEAVRMVNEAVSPEANIIFGATIDDTLGDEIRITVVAAGFDPATQRTKPYERREETARSFDLPTSTAATASAAAVAATAANYGFGNNPEPSWTIDEVSDATGVIETVEPVDFNQNNSHEASESAQPADSGFGDDLDIPDFLK